MITSLPIETEEGVFIATYSENGLRNLSFPGRTTSMTYAAATPEVRKWHRQTEAALMRTLHGERAQELPPLDLAEATDFQRKVWNVLQRIPPGKTLTYSDVASAIGKSKATRAVGNACGANPIPLLIPCHRVLPTSGRLGGFSGGLDWKYRLLEIEGVNVPQFSWMSEVQKAANVIAMALPVFS
jgi:methylated-DNA-[protein]-cysteine S-methyltransferase